jgi:hypothetical protein
MGAYFSLGLRLVHTHRILTAGTPGVTRYEVMKQREPYLVPGIDVQYGYRAVIGNRFLLSVGVCSMMFPSHLLSSPDSVLVSSTENDYSNYRMLLREALTRRYLIGAYLNIGVFLTR